MSPKLEEQQLYDEVKVVEEVDDQNVREEEFNEAEKQ